MKNTTFCKIPIASVFKWGRFFYLRLDAPKYKNMLAVNLTTGVTELFDSTNRVKTFDGRLQIGDISKVGKGIITLHKIE